MTAMGVPHAIGQPISAPPCGESLLRGASAVPGGVSDGPGWALNMPGRRPEFERLREVGRWRKIGRLRVVGRLRGSGGGVKPSMETLRDRSATPGVRVTVMNLVA